MYFHLYSYIYIHTSLDIKQVWLVDHLPWMPTWLVKAILQQCHWACECPRTSSQRWLSWLRRRPRRSGDPMSNGMKWIGGIPFKHHKMVHMAGYLHIYIYMCVCVCVCVWLYIYITYILSISQWNVWFYSPHSCEMSRIYHQFDTKIILLVIRLLVNGTCASWFLFHPNYSSICLPLAIQMSRIKLVKPLVLRQNPET